MNENRRKVRITIESFSQNDGRSVFLTDGWYSGRGRLHSLEYTEKGEDFSETAVRLLFSGDHASVIRRGSSNSKMDFYPDTVKSTYYETQYGAISMETETRQIVFSPTKTGYEGRLSYKIFFGEDRGNFDEKDVRIRVDFCER